MGRAVAPAATLSEVDAAAEADSEAEELAPEEVPAEVLAAEVSSACEEEEPEPEAVATDVVHVRVVGRDGGRHGDHRFERIAALGEDGAACLGGRRVGRGRNAAPVSWVDWSSVNSGVLDHNGQTTHVSLSGIADAHDDGSPFYYDYPDTFANFGPYDLIRQVGSGRVTLSFDTPLTDIYMAMVSVGYLELGVTYSFDRPFSVISTGPNFWSDSFYTLDGNSLTGHEFHRTAVQFADGRLPAWRYAGRGGRVVEDGAVSGGVHACAPGAYPELPAALALQRAGRPCCPPPLLAAARNGKACWRVHIETLDMEPAQSLVLTWEVSVLEQH